MVVLTILDHFGPAHFPTVLRPLLIVGILVRRSSAHFSEGEKCHKSKSFREILPNMAPGHLFMLGLLAVPKIIYVRPVGSRENTSNIGENPNINNLT